MTTDPQHLLPAHTPFYKTRKFWLTILLIAFTVNVYLYFVYISGSLPDNIEDFYHFINSILGGTLFLLLGNSIAGKFGYYLGGFVYIFLLCLLLYKSLKLKKVKMIYPIITLSFLILNFYTYFLFSDFT